MAANLKISRWLLNRSDRSFTIREAAEDADVNTMTLRSFIERRRHLFEIAGRDETGRPGGQPVRYRMRPTGLEELRVWVEPSTDEASKEALPSGLLAALDELITNFPKANSETDREETLEIARRNLAEGATIEGQKSVALYSAYTSVERLCEMELSRTEPASDIQPAMVDCMQKLVAAGEPEWSAQVGLRFLTSPLNGTSGQLQPIEVVEDLELQAVSEDDSVTQILSTDQGFDESIEEVPPVAAMQPGSTDAHKWSRYLTELAGQQTVTRSRTVDYHRHRSLARIGIPMDPGSIDELDDLLATTDEGERESDPVTTIDPDNVAVASAAPFVVEAQDTNIAMSHAVTFVRKWDLLGEEEEFLQSLHKFLENEGDLLLIPRQAVATEVTVPKKSTQLPRRPN